MKGVESEDVIVTRGLRQGCPLSPLLYMLCVAGMEERLIQSRVGFSLTHLEDGEVVNWVFPGLTFADDIVLMAEAAEDMQRLLDICTAEAAPIRRNTFEIITLIFASQQGEGPTSSEKEVSGAAIAAQAKPTLLVYSRNKLLIAAETLLYDNSLGSRLLFEARAGALRTLVYRERFDPKVVSTMCRVCREEPETVEHLVLYCECLLPTPLVDRRLHSEVMLAYALGFKTTANSDILYTDGADDPPQDRHDISTMQCVRRTKARLEHWWKKI
ncbi:hypothetical protein HPB47_027487 [Ixodes persulcatus]|uniref:Uncharacterized protein n=1 Tax=Ixodes persulcatus TaxID=34615 RepID=A0AC60PY57_IXOPE|nr:hypothetical protein HPB47_027487 [Ixodes persulcatus]